MRVLIDIVTVKTKNIKEVIRNLNLSLEAVVEAGGEEGKKREVEALLKTEVEVIQSKKKNKKKSYLIYHKFSF